MITEEDLIYEMEYYNYLEEVNIVMYNINDCFLNIEALTDKYLEELDLIKYKTNKLNQLFEVLRDTDKVTYRVLEEFDNIINMYKKHEEKLEEIYKEIINN